MKKDSAYWISKLNLQKHREGGYFIESYKSIELVNLPNYHGPRHVCTAIYYLLKGDEFSSFHVMKSDELWHFYAGSSLTLFIIEPNGRLNEVILGENIDNGHTFQAAITAGCWFAAAVDDYNSYSLVGCTVSPGFDYQDWKIGDRKILTKLYPQHKSIIEKYTK
ncbi:MAG TPA: cupin domain-containing protein [Nitrososphaeraceae archaeon]